MASGRRIFSYPEERPGFQVPEKYRQRPQKEKPSRFQDEIRTAQDLDRPQQDSRSSDETVVGDQEPEASGSGAASGEGQKDAEGKEGKKDDTIVVGWYGEDDPENPQNW